MTKSLSPQKHTTACNTFAQNLNPPELTSTLLLPLSKPLSTPHTIVHLKNQMKCYKTKRKRLSCVLAFSCYHILPKLQRDKHIKHTSDDGFGVFIVLIQYDHTVFHFAPFF